MTKIFVIVAIVREIRWIRRWFTRSWDLRKNIHQISECNLKFLHYMNFKGSWAAMHHYKNSLRFVSKWLWSFFFTKLAPNPRCCKSSRKIMCTCRITLKSTYTIQNPKVECIPAQFATSEENPANSVSAPSNLKMFSYKLERNIFADVNFSKQVVLELFI